ncbi:enolase C-terminal domain-like protein [Staphylothermus hellenicus]|uniref:enolase C-terminal domain-like protein n=1 Tax=Staphylothermus hellenicus TaxID=84599 RepID=UPI0001C4553A|nr:enolase C-terminal domain-like protein [Staphylothermus hellenicus]
MIEQPLHYDDLYEHFILRREIETPVCLDESIKNIHDTKAGYGLGSYKILNIKPARVGGLVETLKIHEFAEKHNIPLWIGGLETGIERAFQIAAATLPMIKYPSDISESTRFYIEEIVEPPSTLNRDRTYNVPGKAGIGVDVLYEKIMKHAVKTINIML